MESLVHAYNGEKNEKEQGQCVFPAKGLGRDRELLFFFLRLYLFIFRERGKEGEREGEKHQCVVPSCMSIFGGLACNPGMCPDWESNR